MGGFSAACVVDRSTDGHCEIHVHRFGDPRHAANPTYRFMAAISLPVAFTRMGHRKRPCDLSLRLSVRQTGLSRLSTSAV
jgi:hypothetical protein